MRQGAARLLMGRDPTEVSESLPKSALAGEIVIARRRTSARAARSNNMDDEALKSPPSLARGDARVVTLNASVDGVEPALVVTTHAGSQYAFNVPEGFARLALECKIRPTGKLRAVFAADDSAASLGGLTGLILRLSADGHERLAVVGPSGTSAQVEGARKCTRWVHPEVDGVELCANSKRCGGIGCYADNAVTVWPLFLEDTCECLVCEWENHRRQTATTSDEEEDVDEGGHIGGEQSEGVEDDKMASPSSRVKMTSTDNTKTACVGYVCEVKEFDDAPGVRIAIIHVKSMDLIARLDQNPTLNCFASKDLHSLDAMFHCSPTDVADAPGYKSWLESVDCEHFFCRAQNELGFRASARMSLRLNTVDAESFPIPRAFGDSDAKQRVSDKFTSLGLCACVHIRKNTVAKCEVDHVVFRPDDVDPDAVLNELATKHPELAAAAQASLTRIHRKETVDLEENGDAETSQAVASNLKSRLMRGLIGRKKQKIENDTEVIFLGTGSAEPNKYRGSSGILTELPRSVAAKTSKTWMMLDCGEGTVGSIQRMFGCATMKRIVKNLKVVWISHHHADHMLGVRGLLEVHARVCNAPLTLVGPRVLEEWLHTCGVSQNLYHFVHSRDLFAGPFGRLPPPPPPTKLQSVSRSPLPPPPPLDEGNQRHSIFDQSNASAKSMESRLMQLCGLSRFEAVAVEHCRDAAALVVGSPSGWSLAYSGDCRPSRGFARAAKGCALMIHEATFDNELSDHAVRKRHSTTAEALQIAADAGVKHIVLTHFSQRYPKAIYLDEVKIKPIIAFDGFRLRYSQLERVQNLQHIITMVNGVSSSNVDKI